MPGIKRKAAGSGDVPNAGAGEALPSLAVRRERLKSHLLTFPEAAALDELQLYDAVDRIFKEYDPSTATPTPQDMVRLDDDSIIAAFDFANRWLLTSTADDEPPAGADPLGWLDQRRQMLDEEMRPEKRYDSRFVVPKMRIDLLTKGYVELPRAYIECIPVLPSPCPQPTREHHSSGGLMKQLCKL